MCAQNRRVHWPDVGSICCSWQCLNTFVQLLHLAQLHTTSQFCFGPYRIQDVHIDTSAIIGVLILAI